MKSKTLRLILAVALAAAMAPVPAFAADADEGAGAAEQTADGDIAASADDQPYSWRYGRDAAGCDSSTQLDVSLLSADQSAKSARSTWTKTNGAYSTIHGGKRMTVTNALEFGIDVSYHNGDIDWARVKKAGVDFAIIRCGYTGICTQAQIMDSKFLEYVKGCRDNGIKLGVYYYSYAWTRDMASREADHVLSLLRQAGLEPEDLAYPVFYDMEEEDDDGNPSVAYREWNRDKTKKIIIWKRDTPPAMLNDMAEAFTGKLAEQGYKVGIYANKNWFENFLTGSFFQSENYYKWVAQYPYSGKENSVATYKGTHHMWQCMSTGAVDGISGDVDINFSYTALSASPAPVRYRVTYKLNGGKNHAANTATYTASLALKNPTRAGYKFEGWYTDASFKNKVTKLTSQNATVHAKWTQPYKITYKLNGGKNNKANPSKYGGTITLKNPKRSGYTFAGWYTNKKFTAKSKVTKLTNKKVTLYARWKKNYRVTYKLNGGKNNKANPSKYGGTLTLKSPTRSGYTFAGWYTNKKFTAKSRVTKISVTKNRTVYARWKKNTAGIYRITATSGLNIRQKASTSAPIMGGLSTNERVRVNKVSGTWGRLADGRGWIKLDYAVKV